MKPTLSPRAFLVRTLLYTLAVLLVAGTVMFLTDPYQYYRKSPAGYAIDERFSTPGMIRHFEYDAALVGSSMCQNFDMDLLDETTQSEVLKLVKGGMTPAESALLLDLLSRAGKAETVYLGLDLSRFNEEEAEEYYPAYLTNDTALDDWRYLFGYEAWMRHLPLDLAIAAAETAGISLPSTLTQNSDPDQIGRWMERAIAQKAFVGADRLVENYLEGKGTVSKQDTEGMYERMTRKLDDWLAGDPFDEGVHYYVFFSPYSALYWAHTAREGSLETFLTFRTYFFERLRAYENVTPIDFQAMEETRNLDLYKDVSHYHSDINDRMTKGFVSGEFVATEKTVCENNDFLRESVRLMQEAYPALIP